MCVDNMRGGDTGGVGVGWWGGGGVEEKAGVGDIEVRGMCAQSETYSK